MRLTVSAGMVGLLAIGVSQAPAADTISFDPDGNGPDTAQDVASFDLLPGNALADREANDAPGTFTQYAQARLGSLRDESGNVVNTPGLNEDYEITVTAEYEATENQVTSNITELGLAGNQPMNNLQFFFDDTPDSNDLQGTGFFDGQQIYEGIVNQSNGVFRNSTGEPVDFDQYVTNNYPNQLTVEGTGGIRLTAATDSADDDFFLQAPNLQQIDFDTSSSVPFEQTNPSRVFDDGAKSPNLGPVNGTGEDTQLQADASSSFVVPEPTSLALLGLGGLTMIGRRRRSA